MLSEKDVKETIITARQFYHTAVEKISSTVTDVESHVAVDTLDLDTKVKFNATRCDYMLEAVRRDSEYINKLTVLEGEFTVALYELLQEYESKINNLKQDFIGVSATNAAACRQKLTQIAGLESQ